MLDLGFVRANLQLVEEKLRARGADPAALLGDFRTFDQARRKAITDTEQTKARLNQLSQEVGALKKTGLDTSSKIEDIRKVKEELNGRGTITLAIEVGFRDLLARIPNLTRDEVPVGCSEADNVAVKFWGEKPSFDFEPKPHWELGKALGILDLERAAKLSGARFAVYIGAGARLERALISFMLDMHTEKHGYTEVLPPFLVNSESMFGTGQLPKFEDDLFKVEGSGLEQDISRIPSPGEIVFVPGHEGFFLVKRVIGSDVEGELCLPNESRNHLTVPKNILLYQRKLYLIPTAEVPVTNLYRDEILDEARLPICLTAYTPCFRAEAGAAGKDTRGIIRQHQFQKVELVKFTRPEDSDAEHERLTRDAEEVLEALGLPYRRVLLCTGDTGFSSAKTYDLEVWLPGQQLYREISSCSNFDAFQARRANIRYRPASQPGQSAKVKPEFVHTINGSGLAVGRTWLAILENYQQPDGSVLIPQALQPYMGGLDRIQKESRCNL